MTTATTPTLTDTVVIEWAPFRLADGVSESDLLRASDALQAGFLANQPGFLRRDLLRGSDGQWVDLVYWADAASAERVMPIAMESALCLEYFRLLAGLDGADPAAGVFHYTRLKTYG
jgi:hypothetical protein